MLVACYKFKGTLSAREVAACIADGIRAVAPRVPVVAVPVADGGDCTLVAVEESGFEGIPVTVDGPTGEAVLTRYAARVSAYDLTCRSWYDLTCRSRRIREAMERGEFDNLPGAGRPLDLGVPGRELGRAPSRPGRPLGRAPGALGVRRQKQDIQRTLADVADEETAQAIIAHLNQRIAEANIIPWQGPMIITGRLDVDRTLAEWRRRRVERGFSG